MWCFASMGEWGRGPFVRKAPHLMADAAHCAVSPPFNPLQGVVNKLTDYGVPEGNVLGIRYGFRRASGLDKGAGWRRGMQHVSMTLIARGVDPETLALEPQPVNQGV